MPIVTASHQRQRPSSSVNSRPIGTNISTLAENSAAA
jgi:hypothetical protein